MGKVTFNVPDFREGAKQAIAHVQVNLADVAVHWGAKALFKTLGKYYVTDDQIATSYLGTPVFSNLTFGRVIETFLTKFNRDSGAIISDPTKNFYYPLNSETPVEFTPIRIDAVLMTVSKSKRIVKTELQGYEGTVKEYIGSDDYQISVQGVINIEGHKYPKEAVEILKKICEIPDQIPVTSPFLEMFGIGYVVITDYTFEEQRGQRSEQAFSITMISDVAPELEVGDIETISTNYDQDTNAQNA